MSEPTTSDPYWEAHRLSVNDPNRGKSTPRPWRVDGKRVRCDVEGHYRGPAVADCDLTHGLGDAHDTDLANARLIVTAVNCHADLLAALREVAHHADDECGFMVTVRAAIARAEGRS